MHHHNHHQHASHSHEHIHRAQANKDHFDETAEKYEDIPQAKEITQQIARIMLDQYAFQKDTTEVMDFACGTGLVSRPIAPYAKSILGVDISQGMVNVYNKRATQSGIENIKAVAANILANQDDLGGQKFDVIICSMAYHHMTSLIDTTRTLVSFLKPGGSLLVADWDKPPQFLNEEKHVEHTVGHHLITVPQIKQVFEEGGLRDITIADPFETKVNDAEVRLFVAQGKRKVETYSEL